MHRFLACLVVLSGMLAFAQKAWTPPKTPWGDPDLQGVWPTTDLIGVPVQRPASFGDRAELTDEELAQRQARAKSEEAFDNAEFVSEATRCDPKKGGLGN